MTEPAITPDTPCPRLAAWQPAIGTTTLPDGELHLWKWETGAGYPVSEADESLLSPNERRRARAMGSEELRNGFIRNRAAKRRILGAYLDLPPEHIRFGYGRRGKPHLEDPPTGLQFNLSHSGSVSLLVVTRTGEVGIDLEQVRERSHMPTIARRMFGARRAQSLESLPEAERLRMFYVYWTWLEARIKTRGGGLFDTASRKVDGLRHSCFEPHPGFQACVATVGGHPAFDQWRTFLYRG